MPASGMCRAKGRIVAATGAGRLVGDASFSSGSWPVAGPVTAAGPRPVALSQMPDGQPLVRGDRKRGGLPVPGAGYNCPRAGASRAESPSATGWSAHVSARFRLSHS